VPHTALRAATAIGNEAIIRLLVQREAKVINEDAYSCGICRFRTPLYNATQRGDGAIITLLVENCADINAKDHNGDSVFRMEIQIGNESIIRLLIENGADIYAKDRYGKSMLHIATQEENEFESIVRLLIENGADVNATDDDGIVCFTRQYWEEINLSFVCLLIWVPKLHVRRLTPDDPLP
jgi:hypothetical protein